MSSSRKIWNDGEMLSTPELQRPADIAASADDRTYESLLTPGLVQKKVLPLSEESATLNPRLLCIPSSAGLTPAGTNGAVRLLQSQFVAGLASNTQQVALSGTVYAPQDTVAISSNSGGSNRYDLVYVTLQRAVNVTGTRRIKAATDGSISSQTINLQDVPIATLAINAGFLTGATAPTIAQINAALPADTATSFAFPLCYVTVANGYSSGTTLFQNVAGGSTFITQCWPGGFTQTQRVRGTRPLSIYYGSANEKPASFLTNEVQFAERWGSDLRFFGHLKILTTTPTSGSTGIILDNQIDWRRRVFWGFASYLGSANQLPFETLSTGTVVAANNGGMFVPTYSGTNGNGTNTLTGMATSASTSLNLQVDSSGVLRLARGVTNPIDTVNGDLFVISIFATDQMNA